MGFYCDVDGDTEIHLERNELKEGRWVPRAEIEGQADDLSLTNEMMMIFKEGREPKGAATEAFGH
jgi:NAD+ diphosphatase